MQWEKYDVSESVAMEIRVSSQTDITNQLNISDIQLK